MSHSDFRALFESKLQDMDESPMDMPTEQTLYRKYLTKIAPTLRNQVLSKEWKIDGEDKPARTPTTYKEVAKACGLILEGSRHLCCWPDPVRRRHDCRKWGPTTILSRVR
jgi:hypothetical protein